MNINSFEKIINEAWNNKSQVNSKSSRKLLNAISKTIDFLDSRRNTSCWKKSNEWVVNQWIKKAILLSFRVNKMKTSKGPYAVLGMIKLKAKLKNGMKKNLLKKVLDLYQMEQ